MLELVKRDAMADAVLVGDRDGRWFAVKDGQVAEEITPGHPLWRLEWNLSVRWRERRRLRRVDRESWS